MPPEVAAALDALTKLGIVGAALALAIIVIGLPFYTGRVRVGSLVDKNDERRDKREAEMKEERDAALALLSGVTPEIKRLNDLLGTAVNLLLDPRRSEAEIERIVKEVRRTFSGPE